MYNIWEIVLKRALQIGGEKMNYSVNDFGVNWLVIVEWRVEAILITLYILLNTTKFQVNQTL